MNTVSVTLLQSWLKRYHSYAYTGGGGYTGVKYMLPLLQYTLINFR